MTLPPASSAASPEPATGSIGLLEVDLVIDGMTGAGCVARIERSLTRLEVTYLRVDLASGRASIRVPAGAAGTDELVAAVRNAGYEAAPAEADADEHELALARAEARRLAYRRRTLWSLAAAGPVLALSEVPRWDVPGWQWIALVLSALVVLWAGWPIHTAALRSVRDLTISPDALAAFAALAALIWSAAAAVAGDLSGEAGRGESLRLTSRDVPHSYFDVAVLLVLLALAVRWFDARAKSRAGLAAGALFRAQARVATVIDAGGTTREIPADRVRCGDRIAVGPSDVIACDGVVEDGFGGVDESLLTGDTTRQIRQHGDAVLGGTQVTDGHLVIRATQPQAESGLRTIIRTVREAQYGRPPAQAIADRCAEVLVPSVAGIAILTLAGWLVAGEPAGVAFGATLAVLAAGCPTALALAVSAPQLVGTGRGARLGLLLRSPSALAETRLVDIAVFGRSGTLGHTRLTVESVTTAVGTPVSQALRLVGAVESASDHPAAQAVAAEALTRVGHLPPVSEFVEHGAGAEGIVADRRVVVGRRSLTEQLGLTVPPALDAVLTAAEQDGRTAVAAGWYGEVRAVLTLADPPADDVAEAITDLRSLGVRPMLMTAAGHQEALHVARAAGIDEQDVFSDVLPTHRPRVIAALQSGGARVAVVGAGRRDDLALAAADLPISIGALPRELRGASGVTIVGGDTRGVASALRLGRRTLANMTQNIAGAVALCVLAVPLAASGMLSPVYAALVMAGGTLAVVLNALRLRRFRR